jgi:hypothetical protein
VKEAVERANERAMQIALQRSFEEQHGVGSYQIYQEQQLQLQRQQSQQQMLPRSGQTSSQSQQQSSSLQFSSYSQQQLQQSVLRSQHSMLISNNYSTSNNDLHNPNIHNRPSSTGSSGGYNTRSPMGRPASMDYGVIHNHGSVEIEEVNPMVFDETPGYSADSRVNPSHHHNNATNTLEQNYKPTGDYMENTSRQIPHTTTKTTTTTTTVTTGKGVRRINSIHNVVVDSQDNNNNNNGNHNNVPSPMGRGVSMEYGITQTQGVVDVEDVNPMRFEEGPGYSMADLIPNNNNNSNHQNQQQTSSYVGRSQYPFQRSAEDISVYETEK